MENKVILISIGGMRPDALINCKNPYVDELKRIASYTLDATTVFPTVELPCYMSMFLSVPPERHGTTTNTYMPQVHPINGLFEQLKLADKSSAMYSGWEYLRDLSRPTRPRALKEAIYMSACSFERTDAMLVDRALNYIETQKPDFVFINLTEADEKGGHDNGWMSDVYLDYISYEIDNIKRVIEKTNGEYTVIVTSDHGGHDRIHGSDRDEDMKIPMIFCGAAFEAGCEISNVSILDIAPTIAELVGAPVATEWEGKSVVNNKGKRK